MPERLHGGDGGRPFNPDEYTVEEIYSMLENAIMDAESTVELLDWLDGGMDLQNAVDDIKLLTANLFKRYK